MEGGIVIKEAISALVSGSGNEGALPCCFNSGSAIFSCDIFSGDIFSGDIFSGDRACFITGSGSIVSDSGASDSGSLIQGPPIQGSPILAHLACLLTDQFVRSEYLVAHH
jgi:hypothetical protein